MDNKRARSQVSESGFSYLRAQSVELVYSWIGPLVSVSPPYTPWAGLCVNLANQQRECNMSIVFFSSFAR